jgi:hypothetical protein
MASQRKLYLKKVSERQIKKQWGSFHSTEASLFWLIRCNQKGEINWDAAPVYSLMEVAKLIKQKRPIIINGEDGSILPKMILNEVERKFKHILQPENKLSVITTKE